MRRAFRILALIALFLNTMPAYGAELVAIAPFQVKVELSELAHASLMKRNESIVVIAYYGGYATPDHMDKADNVGEVSFGDERVEIPQPGVATLSGVKYEAEKLDWVKDKKLMLLINVVSGRKSSEDNLLDCDIFHDEVAQAIKNGVQIKCKLIYGESDSVAALRQR